MSHHHSRGPRPRRLAWGRALRRHEPLASAGARRGEAAFAAAIALTLAACGGATPKASSPHGKATTTAAKVAPPIERLVVAENHTISMVSRDGCLASVKTSARPSEQDELRVSCPKPERMEAWFSGAERVIGTLALAPDDEEEGERLKLPAAKLLTASGETLRVTKPADVEKLAAEVRALAAELASTEAVSPGPASSRGWQMLHVKGPAHVFFAGTPARGVFEARMSTNGQYLCEFVTDVGDGPMRASKSGWISPSTAAQAIDEVLAPFNDASGPGEGAKSAYAAGTKDGTERRSNIASTAEVFARFSDVQDALGDACLPELEPPSNEIGL